ncbi:MAG: electron transfer flavoprotein subunit alpha [Thermofilum sp. ex4484_15]|nr:MAG: electron transfer flavoprotein subunit alpha [Thermofilum sp. ex4484_15]
MVNKSGGVLVYAECKRRKLNRITLELLSAGRYLAGKLNSEVSAVLIGYKVRELAKELICYGADRAYVVDHQSFRYYVPLTYAKVIADLIISSEPEIVLFPADSIGRDLAPRVAAKLNTGLTADCIELDIGDYEDPISGRHYEKLLYQVRPAFSGDIIATIVVPERRPQMATVRPGSFDPLPRDLGREGEIVAIPVNLGGEGGVMEVIKVVEEESSTDLRDAKIIVSGGRGVGGPYGFKLLRELAKELGAKLGASRAAVEAGWISYSHQVGLTGQIVKPKIYIACGISGAIQHIVGIREAGVIIAINRDPDAPIFDYADYGIVGDLFEVIPALISKIKEVKCNK